ncbi:MAG: DNA-directed RNA polymerase subunit omega [Candidatus Symbiodolus clandestinus]
MARVTIEKAVEKVGNRFNVVLTAARAARQIQTYGREPLVPVANHKCTVIALYEVENQLINDAILDEFEQKSQRTATLRVTKPLPYDHQISL